MPPPLTYHLAIRDLLRDMDPHVWKWFANQRLQPSALESLKFDLLKSTYRLSREAHATLYEAADSVAQFLQIHLPVTLYQSQSFTTPNASIMQATEEVHIVLAGDFGELLSPLELKALFGHELAHHVLNCMDSNEHLQAWDLMRAACNDHHTHPAFLHSFRHLSLYTEVFCDRTALEVVQDLDAVISMLVKLTMGASNVVAADFLAQAREILDRSARPQDTTTEGLTHPEAYIRAVALELYHRNDPELEQRLAEWIEGPSEMASLDLIQQRDVSRATRQLLHKIFAPPALRTELMLSHARLYFEDFSFEECGTKPHEQLTQCLAGKRTGKSVLTYFCFVLLDFASADRDLDELLLANALQVSEDLGIKDTFAPIARKELKLRKNQMDHCDRTKQQILQAATTKQNV